MMDILKGKVNDPKESKSTRPSSSQRKNGSSTVQATTVPLE
jgi:hypothetical protein